MSRADYVDLPEWLNRVDRVSLEKEEYRNKKGRAEFKAEERIVGKREQILEAET